MLFTVDQKQTRRAFLRGLAARAGITFVNLPAFSRTVPRQKSEFLEQFDYKDVQLSPGLHRAQFEQTIDALMKIDEDSMLHPFRERAGLPAPGPNIGGWYINNPDYDSQNGATGGFAPGHCFGQWVSALCRVYAITGNEAYKNKVQRLVKEYEKTCCEAFFIDFRFPAYTYDKLVLMLIDAYEFTGMDEALTILNKLTDVAVPHLPEKALDRLGEMAARPHKNASYTWDESYTMPENLYLAYQRGAGRRYLHLARKYLKDDTYFNPLSRNENVLAGRHAYSYMNALSSAMSSYMVDGSAKHFAAANNAFNMIDSGQSYATGGWGPDEMFVAPGSGKLGESLKSTHCSFETPCGSYAHFKLTRYLSRTTADGMYGDSMERMMYNTVLGALPMSIPGKAFYYADYNYAGKKVYHNDVCPCCAGTLPQVAADYGINSYFHDRNSIYVNLYIPSSIRWHHHDSEVTLTQAHNYPLEPKVQLTVSVSQPKRFPVRLRIPKWTGDNYLVCVNGNAVDSHLSKQYLTIERVWNSGDQISLELPMSMRLEAVDPEHPDVVALVRGPLVLFAITDKMPPITKSQLLAARQIGAGEWRADTSQGPLRLIPFTSINDEPYTTYLTVT